MNIQQAKTGSHADRKMEVLTTVNQTPVYSPSSHRPEEVPVQQIIGHSFNLCIPPKTFRPMSDRSPSTVRTQVCSSPAFSYMYLYLPWFCNFVASCLFLFFDFLIW